MMFSFLIFLHARCKSEFSVFYLRMARAVFEGTSMVNVTLKAETGIIDHGVKTGSRNFCRTASKSLGF